MKRDLTQLWCACLFGLALLVTGCSSSSGTLSKDPVAFLRITGIKDNLIATVDELPAVSLLPEDKPTILQLVPGKHRIKIMHGEALLVDRVVLISDQQTLEISIP